MKTLLVCALLLALSGCANPYSRVAAGTVAGGATGAVAGAGIGSIVCAIGVLPLTPACAALGAKIGAIAGAAVGAEIGTASVLIPAPAARKAP